MPFLRHTDLLVKNRPIFSTTFPPPLYFVFGAPVRGKTVRVKQRPSDQQKTRMMVLSGGKRILALFIQSTRVTDTQTDENAVAYTR